MLDPDVLDVCAGIGGWAVALRERGLTDLAVENNPHAQAALAANGLTLYHDDLVTLANDPEHLARLAGRLSGAVGSTPCQPFSQANGNARGLEDPRGNLTLTFGAVALATLPPFVCLENVSRGTGPVFDYLAEKLREAGYTADHRIVCAADYGLPQARKRRLLAARRDGRSVTWPKRTHADTRTGEGRLDIAADRRRPWVTLADTFPDQAQADRWPAWTGQHPATTIVGSFEPDKVAPPTYRKPGDGPRQTQPGTVSLTLEQRLKVQGFPDGWKLSGPKTAQGLQVGNAIPPTLARVALSAALD